MANSNIEAGVYLDIHEATAYAGRPIQVSINKLDADGGGHGYRIAGPKFTLSGSRLLRRVKLDARTAAEIRCYLDMVEPAPTPAPPAAEKRELQGIAEAFGRDVLRRWEDGDDSLDLAAEVAALRGARDHTRGAYRAELARMAALHRQVLVERDEEIKRLAAEVAALPGTVAGYRRTLDEALNSGDGSYRP